MDGAYTSGLYQANRTARNGAMFSTTVPSSRNLQQSPSLHLTGIPGLPLATALTRTDLSGDHDMGCDIHLFHEMRCNTTGRWLPCDTWDDDDGRIGVAYGRNIYDGRNYTLFAALANVRNNRPGDETRWGPMGTACDGGDPIPVIHPPKGIPPDACEEIQTHVKEYAQDGHSHSYYTLQELLDFDWNGTEIVNRGVVSNKDELDRIERMRAFYKKHSPHKVEYVGPDSYCQATSQDGATVVTWKSTLADDCREFLSSVVLRLSALAKIHSLPYTDIRIVFFFDN